MEEKTKTKVTSRKFFVLLIWIIIALIMAAVSLAVVIITKRMPDSLIDMIGSVITYLFFISLAYLGVNVGQKVGVSYADALKEKYKSSEENTTENPDNYLEEFDK